MQYYKVNQVANAGVFTPPGLAAFLRDLRDSFKKVDEEESSLVRLELLQQGGKPVEEHNTKFKLLAGQTGITNDKTLVNIYWGTISKGLLEKIISHTPLPTTLTNWINKAVQLDKQWRMMMEILDKLTSKRYSNDSMNKYKFKIPAYHDPNAMDVDALSIAEREDRKKGMLCYNCEKPGHFAQECKQPKKKKGPFKGALRFKKWFTSKDLQAHIHAMLEDMDKEEQDEFYEEAEREGLIDNGDKDCWTAMPNQLTHRQH
jgi:hypothetical protein